MRALFFAALIAIGSTSVGAQTVQIDRIEILNFGIYLGQITKHEEQPGTPAGINTVENRKLVKQTETIPGRIGTRFGIEYVVRGRPQNKVVTITCITRFPSQGLVNDKGQKFTKSEFIQQDIIGENSVRTYTFDNSWEVVPGIWSLEFYYEGRKVGEKLFNIVVE